MKTVKRIAAPLAIALVAFSGCGADGLAGDPYWATCEQLADVAVRADVAKELTRKADMPMLTTGGVAERLERICSAEVGAYRPGLDAVRQKQSASL